jgi:predicted amidohydrolase YtcJ
MNTLYRVYKTIHFQTARFIVVLSGLGLLLLGACSSSEPPPTTSTEQITVAVETAEVVENFADRVMTNGKIMTVDDAFSIVEAIAIKDERILAVGDADSIGALIGPSTEVTDLAGKTVIPGLIDNHMHFIRGVQNWHIQARIDGITSRAEALDIIATKAATMAPGEWLTVQGGWSEVQFVDEPGGFTIEELDRAVPNNPLFIQRLYRTVFANTKALETVGMTTADGAEHRARELISGEPPYGAFGAQLPEVSEQQRMQNLADFGLVLNASGLTSVYDVGRPPEGDITLLDRVDGPLPLRVWNTLKYQAYDPDGAEAAIELIESNKPLSTDEWKGMLGLGEHVYLPFFDNPGTRQAYPDDVMDVLMKILGVAAENGYPVHEHTMSDITVSSLLPRLDVLNQTTPLAPLRWTLAHLFTFSKENIEHANKLGLAIAIHSVAMHETRPNLAGDGLLVAGPPLRDIQDSGIAWGLGTDATIVAHYQPFATLGWAVSGENMAGIKVLAQPVTREEALIAHTRSNAWILFQEDNIGSLEVGKFADLVVLDRDYMSIPAAEIYDIQPVMTMVGGRVVFDAN